MLVSTQTGSQISPALTTSCPQKTMEGNQEMKPLFILPHFVNLIKLPVWHVKDRVRATSVCKMSH